MMKERFTSALTAQIILNYKQRKNRCFLSDFSKDYSVKTGNTGEQQESYDDVS
jgi:hypothetical protein